MAYLRRLLMAVFAKQQKQFRTINVHGSANGAFLAVVAVPRINKLRIINTLNSSTPVASTTISFIITCLLTYFNLVQ